MQSGENLKRGDRQFGEGWYDGPKNVEVGGGYSGGLPERSGADYGESGVWHQPMGREEAQGFGRMTMNVAGEQGRGVAERRRRVERKGSLAERRSNLSKTLARVRGGVATAMMIVASFVPTGASDAGVGQAATANLVPPNKIEQHGEMPSMEMDLEASLAGGAEYEQAEENEEDEDLSVEGVRATVDEEDEQEKQSESEWGFEVGKTIELRGIDGVVEVPEYYGGYVDSEEAYRKEFSDKYV